MTFAPAIRDARRSAPSLLVCLWLVAAACPGPADDDDTGDDDTTAGDDDTTAGDDDTADDDTADDDDDTTAAALDAEIEDNPLSPLSCWVVWQTDEPASSAVEFGPAGTLAFRRGSDELVTDHRVLVIGMRAETEYRIEAVSVTDAGETLRSGPLTHTTGPLPFDGLTLDVTVHEPALVQPGWVLADLTVEDHADTSFIAMFDLDGHIVWIHGGIAASELGGRDASLVDDGEAVLIGGYLGEGEHAQEVALDNTVRWLGPQQPGLGADGVMHHMFRKLDNGHYAALMHDHAAGPFGDRIVELDAQLNEIWSWNTTELCAQICDSNPVWGNTVQIDLDGDVAYYNSMLYSTFVKIDRPTGEIVWMLGEHRDFQEIGPPGFWFHNAHTPTVLSDGHVLVYDNGGNTVPFSRVVELAIDEVAMTAEIVWEYPGPVDDPWKNENMGAATRLDNGNTFIVTGTTFPEVVPTTLFEVTPGLAKAWEVEFVPDVAGEIAACSHAVRIPALVEAL